MTDTTTPSVAFRSPDTSVSDSSTTSIKSDPSPTTQTAKTDFNDAPPSLWGELHKQPFAVKHLELGLYHDDGDFPEVREQAKALDEYVLKQIKARGMEDTAASYKEVIDAIYKQIGRSPNENPTQAVKRLSVAASAIQRLESAKLAPVLSAKSMTADEFEEVLP